MPIIPGGPGFIPSPGPANQLTVGDVTTVPSGSRPYVTITGESPHQTINFGLPAGLPEPVTITADIDGKTHYTLPFSPLAASSSVIEFNGIGYRLTLGDYTIADNTLVIINPVIAPRAGDIFLFVSN